MGELARTLVSLSGPNAVHGIIPEALVRYERNHHYTSSPSNGEHGELPVPDTTLFGRTTVVKDMHTRKQMMVQEVIDGGPGSGFIALSGGYGTLEELLETCTWNQLGIHNKGICLFNVDGYYDGMLAWISKAIAEGFIKSENGRIITQATNAESVIRELKEYKLSGSVLKLSWGNE